MQPPTVRISDVGRKNGHRTVVFEADGTEFGVFDGYKQGADGVMRIATAPWMDDTQVRPVVRATMEVAVEPVETAGQTIEASSEQPTGWEDHLFWGQVVDVLENTATVLESVRLFDDTDRDSPGVGLDPTPFEDEPSAVVDVGIGAVLLDLADVAVDVESGEYLRCTASRTDLLGYDRRA
ncbi:hypothetical protein IL252_05975 [Halomicrobium sp. IBSBa]|uniref:hypothetical protein n=1 Tax=Halomicrobium sp. IBSBa TaxID=2778916 RepID=UPI001ABF2B0E|nr:hypothetical protein [Halomicrobium sp. IBSBa]MBO4247369.1 hypothetical protein [Halomicrobium sp. IBSBa]